jgi:hypothetical protein
MRAALLLCVLCALTHTHAHIDLDAISTAAASCDDGIFLIAESIPVGVDLEANLTTTQGLFIGVAVL